MALMSNNRERGFTAREARALLWLLPVLAVVSWLVWEVATATVDYSCAETGNDSLPASLRGAGGDEAIQNTETGLFRADSPCNDGADSEGKEADISTPQLFIFDPNTVEYHDLVRLGFERGEALGIIKYRERGKVFEIPEDFAACYQVSEEMYLRLKPYIRIGEQYRLKGWTESREEKKAGSVPSVTTPSASRPPLHGRGTADGNILTDGRDESSIPPRVSAQSLRPALIDLNTADSATLISVVGIGERTVVSIMEYRARLGGFAAVEQLAEVRGVTEQNYERIIEQIYLDPAVIQKIDINFAPAKSLARHPYMRAEALRKLLKNRQLKGGWRTVEELEADDIFTVEELEKLGPYLIFN